MLTIEELVGNIEIPIEYESVIEYELDNYVSIIYNKDTKEYCIRYIDAESYEEIEIALDENEPLENIMINGIIVSDEDFQYVKKLVSKV